MPSLSVELAWQNSNPGLLQLSACQLLPQKVGCNLQNQHTQLTASSLLLPPGVSWPGPQAGRVLDPHTTLPKKLSVSGPGMGHEGLCGSGREGNTLFIASLPSYPCPLAIPVQPWPSQPGRCLKLQGGEPFSDQRKCGPNSKRVTPIAFSCSLCFSHLTS